MTKCWLDFVIVIAAVSQPPIACIQQLFSFLRFFKIESERRTPEEKGSEEKSLYCTAVQYSLRNIGVPKSGLIHLNNRSCTKFFWSVPNTIGYQNQRTMTKNQVCGSVLSQSTNTTEIFELYQILDVVLVARESSILYQNELKLDLNLNRSQNLNYSKYFTNDMRCLTTLYFLQ